MKSIKFPSLYEVNNFVIGDLVYAVSGTYPLTYTREIGIVIKEARHNNNLVEVFIKGKFRHIFSDDLILVN